MNLFEGTKVDTNIFLNTKINILYSSFGEFKIGQIVKKIDNYSDRFVPAISSCKINLNTINKDIIKDCDVIKNNKDKFVSMKFSYLKHINLNKFFSIERTNL